MTTEPSLSLETLFSTPPDTFTNETISLIISELRRWRLAYINGEAKPGEEKVKKPREKKTPATKPEKLSLADIPSIDID